MDKRVLKITVGLVLLSFFACLNATWAQRSLLTTMAESCRSTYQSGRYLEALEIVKKTEAMLPGEKLLPGELAYFLSLKGEVLRSLGQYGEAEDTFKLCLKQCEKEPGKLDKTATVPTVYLDLPLIYEHQGRYAEAEAMWKQCELMSNRTPNYCCYPVNHLATLYMEWGKLDQAEKYIKLAQNLARRAPKSVAVPYSHLTTAMFLKQKGQYKQSDEEFAQGLIMCANIVGKSHPYYGKILLEQADLYRQESRFADAEKNLNQALNISQATYSGDHPDTADIMVHLASVLSEEGKYGEARDLVQKALKMDEKVYGSNDNIFTSKAKQCLGNILRQDGRYQEAQDMIGQALATERKIFGHDTIDTAITMRDLAMVYEDQAEVKEAESLLKDSLAVITQQTGPDHPQRADANNALAHLYLSEGKYSDAEPLLKAALDLSERVLGEKHTVTASSARDLGELYAKQKQFSDAEKYLQQALSVDEELFGEKAPQVASDLMTLATVYGADGKGDQAEPLLKRAADIKNVLPGGGIAYDIPETVSSSSDRPVTDKWALVVGVSNFKDPTINLKYAAKDATDFRNFLITSEKFRPDHVKLLTDENADRDNVIGMLGDKWLGRHAHPDDLVVVYVSSHGSRSQGDAGGVNFLVAHDTNKNSLPATGIPMQWLSTIIKDQVHSDRVILILDVCHSGSATEGTKGLNRTSDAGVDPKQFKIGSGQMVLCSSSAEQVSWESKGYENSVFTRRLMEALQTSKDKTTLLEAYKQLKVMVESEVLRDRGDLQTPVIMSKTWKGKDPALAVDVKGSGQTTK